MKNHYYTPLSEEVRMDLAGMLAQSGGVLEDLPEDLIFDSSES